MLACEEGCCFWLLAHTTNLFAVALRAIAITPHYDCCGNHDINTNTSDGDNNNPRNSKDRDDTKPFLLAPYAMLTHVLQHLCQISEQ